jgi:hypothetical protein
MMKYQRLGVLIVSIVWLAGCAGTGALSKGSSGKYRNVQTVSVSTFACSDPRIAEEVKNGIIEELLGSYTVILGEGADVSIKGSISLTSSPSGNAVSEIKAEILRDNRVTDSLSLLQSGGNGGAPASPEAMGKKIGASIHNMLSM